MADVLGRDEERGSPWSPGEHQVTNPGRSERYPPPGPHPELAAELRARGQSQNWQSAVPESGQERTAAPLLLGRALLGGFFLYNGINHFQNKEMLTGYARSKGVPAPGAAVAASGAMLGAGGLSLLTGIQPRIGAALAAAFLLGVSPVMHAFWRVEGPQERAAEMVNFTKNVALVGGAMFAAAVPGPWRYAPRFG